MLSLQALFVGSFASDLVLRTRVRAAAVAAAVDAVAVEIAVRGPMTMVWRH